MKKTIKKTTSDKTIIKNLKKQLEKANKISEVVESRNYDLRKQIVSQAEQLKERERELDNLKFTNNALEINLSRLEWMVTVYQRITGTEREDRIDQDTFCRNWK